MSRIEVRKLASMGFLPLEAMALKFTLMPRAAMAMPSTMYAKSTSCGVMKAMNGTKVPMIEAPIKPSMNHGKATVFLPVFSTSECFFSHQIAIMMAANTSMSTRESFMMVAMSTAPKASPAATAWAISCREAPAVMPSWSLVMPVSGPSAISSNANTVPIMATMATAMVTSLSFSSCLSSDTLMEPARPMTAAAPQMPVPPAVRMASIGSTPSLRAMA